MIRRQDLFVVLIWRRRILTEVYWTGGELEYYGGRILNGFFTPEKQNLQCT